MLLFIKLLRNFGMTILYLLIPFLSSVSSGQECSFSSKHLDSIEKKTAKESASYAKSEYKVFDSELSLEALFREYYEYHYCEISEGIRKYATPTAMSREKILEDAVDAGYFNARNSALGIMQLYFYSWINVDDRTVQAQKDWLIQAAEKAEPLIREEIFSLLPIRHYVFYKELKKDFRVETRLVYDQEVLKEICRNAIIKNLDPGADFGNHKLRDLLIFEK